MQSERFWSLSTGIGLRLSSALRPEASGLRMTAISYYYAPLLSEGRLKTTTHCIPLLPAWQEVGQEEGGETKNPSQPARHWSGGEGLFRGAKWS